MTDEELLDDYYKEMGYQSIQESKIREIMVRWMGNLRKEEPRLSCGTHVVDYCNICDDDDNMDSFYGEDYPW